MANNRGGSRTDTMIKLVLIFFISLLSFSVGTYVGKQVTDADHRKAQIEGDYKDLADHETAEGDHEATQDDGEKLSDEEIASLTDEFINKEKGEAKEEKASEQPEREVASSHEETAGYKKYENKAKEAEPAETPAMKEPARQEAAKAEHKPSAAAQRIAEGEAPAADPKEARKPLSVLPSVAGTAVGKFTVQIASYADEEEAKKHAADLKTKGWNAFYVPADIKGKTWYRVSVGLFTTHKSATEFQTEFMKEAKINTAIVQKIVK